MPHNICTVCKTEFDHRFDDVKYCSQKCKKQHHNYPSRQVNKKSYSVSPAIQGTISEVLACNYYLRNGWEVYRNISAFGSNDLIIMRNGEIKKIEVRTGILYKNGKIYYPNKIHNYKNKPDEFCVFVAAQERIYVFPSKD